MGIGKCDVDISRPSTTDMAELSELGSFCTSGIQENSLESYASPISDSADSGPVKGPQKPASYPPLLDSSSPLP